MELTLHLKAGDAGRAGRLPMVKAARSGRTRGQAARIVWHDTLDRALAADGLALAEERGIWRLERHRPAATEPWPPATDHRLIEQAGTPGELSVRAPDVLVPVAAFDGRRTVYGLTIDGETVTMTVLDGLLRAVAAERPCLRLLLSGPGPVVRQLVMAIAGEVELSVPACALAAEALSLADGTKPLPRRSGAPALPAAGMPRQAAFAHIAGHLTDVILSRAPDVMDPAMATDAVHDMRVAVRRARSAISLFHGAGPDAENSAPADAAAALKRMGQMLGPARDWDVFMTETAPPVAAVLGDQPGLRRLLRAGARRRRAAHAALADYLKGPVFRRDVLELACVAAAGPGATDAEPAPLSEFAVSVLQRRWKKLAAAGRSLDELDSTELHGLRLKAKRLRYATEFFAPLFPGRQSARFIRRLAALQERLGVFNDTAAAAALLRELSPSPGHAAGLVLGFTAARGAGIRPKIAASWTRFRRRDAFWA